MSEILPLPRYPRIRGGLESVLAELLGRDGKPLTEDQWRRGVTVTASHGAETFISGYGGGSWGLLADDPEAVKPTNVNGDSINFMPVSIGAIYGCEMNAPGGVQGDVSAQRAEDLVRRRTYSDLARTLVTGEAYGCDGQGNLSFINDGEVVDGGDVGGSIRGVFHGLLAGICGGWDAEPVFHVPLEFMPHFLGDVVRWDEATQTYRMAQYRVSFDCYPNVGPNLNSTPANPDGSEVWVWASMPPMAAVSEDVEIQTVRTELRNQYEVRAERQAIIAFDFGQVLAAKAVVS